ncbi:MAG: aminotransferase class III-fold pyridoxal phosphate-dependent enzyme [Ferruginibacter sp.]
MFTKGITGGFMALGVTVCSAKIFDAFYADEKEKTLYHGHSYTANPLACTAANASLQILKSDECQKNIQRIVQQHQSFATTIANHPLIKETRQRGTILAIEFNTKEGTSYFNSIRDKLYNFYLDNGVLLRPLGNIIYIMPPYCITNDELHKVYDVIIKSFDLL